MNVTETHSQRHAQVIRHDWLTL